MATVLMCRSGTVFKVLKNFSGSRDPASTLSRYTENLDSWMTGDSPTWLTASWLEASLHTLSRSHHQTLRPVEFHMFSGI